MNFSSQPVSSVMPLSGTNGLNSFSGPALQKMLSSQPSLVAQAADQMFPGVVTGSTSPFLSLQQQALNPLTGPVNHTDAEIKQVSKDFESVFMQMLFKEMRNTVQKSDLLGNSQTMEFFESMHDEELSKSLASSNGIGIGNVIYQKLKQATETHQKTFS